MDDWKEKVFVAENENGGVTCIVPAVHYTGTFEDWSKVIELNSIQKWIAVYPIQLPVDRSLRHLWKIQGDKVVVGNDISTLPNS